MRLDEAVALAERLLAEHGQHDVRVEVGNMKRAYGTYSEHLFDRRIKLSAALFELNPDRAEDTVRHEVAHAIAGAQAGHGPQWEAACRITGAEPVAEHDGVDVPHRWHGNCPTHGLVAKRYRLTKAARRYVCGGCGQRIAWEDQTV